MTPVDCPAAESTGAGRAQDPRPGSPRAGRGARKTQPPGSAGSSPAVRRPRSGTAGDSQTPAGAVRRAKTAVPAGSSSLAGPATLPGENPGPGRGAEGPPRPGQGEPRTWTLELPAGMELLSLNGREHWAARHRKAKALKDAAIVMARKAKLPRLERVSVVAEYQPPDRRHRDGDNIAPSAKALVDGLVAAQVLAGDDRRYVVGTFCMIGEPHPKGRLVLHLTEVTA